MSKKRFKILALDPATKVGWAHTDGPSGVWDCSIRRDESGGMRLIRLRAKIQEVFDANPFTLLAYEAARNAAPGMQGALVTQATLQSVIVLWCEDNNVDYRGYSPSEIKKHATGKGNANKQAMIDGAHEKWKIPIEDDNHADALWILDLIHKEVAEELPVDPPPKPF